MYQNNPYFNQFNNPYAPQYNGIQPTMNQNVLPAQQILTANGKASIDALRMAPNSSVLIADSTAPIVWQCVSDGLGNVTAKPFDITEHKETPPVDVDSLEQRVATIENILAQIGETNNEQSTSGGRKQRQPSGDTGKNSAN